MLVCLVDDRLRRRVDFSDDFGGGRDGFCVFIAEAQGSAVDFRQRLCGRADCIFQRLSFKKTLFLKF
ncbi:hypothetical protein BJL95_04535 [Methylomonas sp. LWB]|nr:hypothetical protein BJL95_04535 [Methylomonas sp. LWB]